MTKRIFRSIILVAFVVLLSCFALFLGVLYQYFGSVQSDQLKNELTFAVNGVETEGMTYLNSLEVNNCRLTLVDENGKVLYDNVSDPAKMENHADREEIIEAMKTGYGESSRYSSTLTEQTLYYARKLSNGSVLRISVSRMTTLSLVLAMMQPFFFVVGLALILSLFLASRLSKKIMKPLEDINYDRPLENDTYEELAPILTRMEQHHNMIKNQREELLSKKKEFTAITKRMQEGLVLLNAKGEILSINPAAEDFFETDRKAEGSDFITIERSTEITETLEKAGENGYAEIQVSRKGREYLLRASKVDDGGIVILIFDIADKVFGERNRREFTANVSHELKTPLQSIMGSAELLENNLVKEEDVPVFIGRIRNEAVRLVSLIDDIIKLSSLDEKAELPFEDINLLELATNEVNSLREIAEAKNVSISISGKPVVMSGVKQLVHDIIYNLCENAIKYNKDGGNVEVTVGDCFVRVKDTGIGIAPEHNDRIFERFYRVDKSHSRQIGGTGLGLSIVKHAAEFMNAQIELESEEGVGTCITVNFTQ